MILSALAGAAVAGAAARDVLQREHAITRNFPLIGRMRFLLESVGPELRQYIVTSNDEERPGAAACESGPVNLGLPGAYEPRTPRRPEALSERASGARVVSDAGRTCRRPDCEAAGCIGALVGSRGSRDSL